MEFFCKIINWFKTIWDNCQKLQEEVNRLLSDKCKLLKENAILIEDKAILKEIIKLSEQYEMCFENNVYYNIRDGRHEGPYCTRCWDKDKSAIRLHKSVSIFICPNCRTDVSINNYVSIIHTDYNVLY